MATKHPYGWIPSPLFAYFKGNLGDYSLQKKPFRKHFEAHIRHPHKKATEWTAAEKCPCAAFRVCDFHWHMMSNYDQGVWNDNVKKRHLSGYQFFMKECICLLSAGENFPDFPSVSGGYSCAFVEAGETAPPETIGLPPEEPEEPPAGDPCPHCIGDTPSVLKVKIEFTWPFTGWDPDGTWTLPQSGACWWQSIKPPPGETIMANISEYGRESVRWYCLVGEYGWEWIDYELVIETGETLNLDCDEVQWLHYISSHDPRNSMSGCTINP